MDEFQTSCCASARLCSQCAYMRLPSRPIQQFLWLLLLLAVVSKAQAQKDLPVYNDYLANRFEDRYWTSHNLTNTSPVHSGFYSIKVNPGVSWQGLYLHETSFDTAPYSKVSFWVHGGTNGGQRVQLQGATGNADPPENV